MARKAKALKLNLNGLTAPLVKLELYDGSNWYSIATENYVDSKVGSVTSITAGTGLSGGTITTSGTIALANISGFTPGTYNWPNSLTINAQGQVTEANSGNQPITSIVSNSGLTVNTSGGQSLINIFDTGVTPGTYTWPAGFSVNSMGQLTFVTSSGSLPISRLSGYPANSSVFLRGDGTWATPSSSTIDINSGTSGQLNISRLSGYPSDSSLFLNGSGSWTNPRQLITGASNITNAGGFIVNNTNSSSVAAGLLVQNNGTSAAEFGFNNSTNEAYVYAAGTSILKFGTAGIKRMELLNSGMLNVYYGITADGNINAKTGTLIGNNLSSYNSTAIQVLNPLNMNNIAITNMATPFNQYDAANKIYVDSKVFDINSNTNGQLNINRLSGYPANSSLFLRGDGTWASPSSSLIDINSGTTGQLNISRLSGYPSDSSLFLNGSGSWENPRKITTNSVDVSSANGFIVNNTNLASIGAGLLVQKNGANSAAFGFNNSTNEAHVWSYGTATLKFGTNNIKRAEFLSNGMLNIYYGLTVTGNISAQTGTLIANNLAAYNSSSIQVLNPLAMNSYSIRGLANPSSSQDAATKSYVDNKIFDINNNTTSQLSISRLSGYPANSSLFLRGDGAWATPSGGGLGGSQIGVNTDSGSSNWLRKSNLTRTGVQVYGLTSTSFIVENNVGESSGIGFDADSDACTIWTPGDSGGFLNIQDEDSSNTRVAYVATTGAWTVVSSEKRKHSIRSKRNNNILERFLKLSVKTYGYKYPAEEGLTEKKKQRIKKKSNKMSTGLILEEVFKIFPNCIPDYYNPLFQKKRKNRLRLEKEIKDIKNAGIDYNTLMCYFIMAFQELAKKVEFLEQKLEKSYNLQS